MLMLLRPPLSLERTSHTPSTSMRPLMASLSATSAGLRSTTELHCLRLNGGLVRHQETEISTWVKLKLGLAFLQSTTFQMQTGPSVTKASLVQLFEQKLLHMETGKPAISLIREDLCGVHSSSTTCLGDALQLIKIANQLAVAAMLAGSASKKTLNGPLAGKSALQASMHMIIRISGRPGHAM